MHNQHRNKSKHLAAAAAIVLSVITAGCSRPTRETLPEGASILLAIPLSKEACWQDFAFLAAVPASASRNNGTPLVLALNEKAAVRPETSDFLRRLKPDSVYMLDCATAQQDKSKPLYDSVTLLPANTLDEAACTLANRFWISSETAVCCRDSNYEDALIASALAARLNAPLLFSSKEGLSDTARKTLKTLSAKKLIFIGSEAPSLKGFELTALPSAKDVLRWTRENNLNVEYFAAANPQDRSIGYIRKVSLAAPLLAAGRHGMAVPLNFETEWKIPFTTDDQPSPEECSDMPRTRSGTININGMGTPFVMSCSIPEHDKASCVTNWAEANCRRQLSLVKEDSSLDGPYHTGDRIAVGDKTYTISLDPRSGVGQADLWLTWPGVPEIRERLDSYAEALGGHPEYLCLFGEPDVIPKSILTHDNGKADITSDAPFGNTDDDPFIELSIGRMIGEDVYSAVLTATRSLSYDSLKNGDWPGRYGLAGWRHLFHLDMENVGFPEGPYHSGKDGNVKQDSPLTECAAILHGAHSCWKNFGGFYGWQSRVLLAPAIVESGGCSTMRLDRDAKHSSVPARMLRNGAVCILGNERNGIGQQNLYRSEFWSAITQNKTAGQAHRYALNRALLAALEKGEKNNGGFRYQFYIRALYGDPAVHMSLPTAPASKPAWIEEDGTKVIVHAPETWWQKSYEPNPEWKCKHEILYAVHGAHVGTQTQWSHEERCDMTKHYYTVELHTTNSITGINELDSLPKPLGWTGQYWTDEHPDRTRTLYWRVRLIDFDKFTGNIRSQTNSISYELLTAKE